MDLLKFIICGNVDDGKSTLTGRLLYDTGNIFEDQYADHQDKETGTLDLARVTDGLRSEREHGITIDVAYKYFSTPQRKFICIDAPGHLEYTRNMVSGASQADAAILLIDAKHGITDQTLRHAEVCRFLDIQHIIVAINKMDAVNYLEEIFHAVSAAFEARTQFEKKIHFIPTSGLTGDNVTGASDKLSWYKGPTLLRLLETLPVSIAGHPDKMIVQHVLRDKKTQYIFSYYHLDAAGIFTHVNSGSPLELTIESREGNHYCLSYKGDVAVERGDVLIATRTPVMRKKSLGVALFNLSESALKTTSRYLFMAQNHLQEVTLTAEKNIESNHFGLALLDLDSPVHLLEGEVLKGILVDPQTRKTIAALHTVYSAK